MKISIGMCDDDPTQLAYVKTLLAQWVQANGHSVDVLTFNSAEAFLFAYAENKRFDILLLDIQMPGMDGVELAKMIRRDNETVQLIFITGFADFMNEGYEVSALHYLMKPVNTEKLFAVLDKACKQIGKTERVIPLTIDGESVRLVVGDVLYIEAFAHSVVVCTTNDRFELNQSIGEMETQLGAGFTRCHRSYLVGLAHIKRVTKTDVVLDNGHAIPLSRRAYQQTNQDFIRFCKGE